MLFYSISVYTKPVSVHFFIEQIESVFLLMSTRYMSLHPLLCLLQKKRKYKINGQYSALLLFEALNLSKCAFFKPIYSKTFVFTFEFQGLQNYLRLPSNYLNFIKITPKCIKCATWFRLLNNLNSNLVTCSDRKQQIVKFCCLWLFSLSTWYMHGEFIYLM